MSGLLMRKWVFRGKDLDPRKLAGWDGSLWGRKWELPLPAGISKALFLQWGQDGGEVGIIK